MSAIRADCPRCGVPDAFDFHQWICITCGSLAPPSWDGWQPEWHFVEHPQPVPR